MKVRSRFAPSPTGRLHLGNAWTALMAWLDARQRGGSFVWRLEDLDPARSREEYAEAAMADLRWLGLDWDEGPDVGGPFSPYRQSARMELYAAALADLREQGRLYPCFCSRAELMAVASAPHGLHLEGPVYPGTCRRLDARERAERAQRKPPSIRFMLPRDPVVFHDLAAGPQCFPPGAGGDFIVKRADGVFAYQLACVVDDAAMGITHVVRGFDLLDSTPRQIHLYRALGWRVPWFAHVPLLLGTGGERLSKRDRSVELASLRMRGIRPEQVVGCLALLAGLTDRPEPVRARDLVGRLQLPRLPKGQVALNEPVRKALGLH
ncbi:MAG: tRNA glutamyl-Q(34) synthetase GluQRS [Alicyclobacillaceae bacterium]|nr:tRNA glutamyl-Q(34) synthetase GluQRS [Alicyclobacillaceae bacterium]